MANNRVHRDEGDRAHLPRTGHNLSHKYSFTAACGQLLPTFWDYAYPGDTYRLGTGFDLSRALPLLNPASIDLTVVTDYFFVPMDLMDITFGSKYEGVRDVFSTAVDDGILNIDLVRMQYMPEVLAAERFRRGPSMFDSFGVAGFRLFDMLGYSPLDWTPSVAHEPVWTGQSGQAYPLTYHRRPDVRTFLPYPFLTYQCIYQYFYRDEEIEPFDPGAFNLDFYNRSDSQQPQMFAVENDNNLATSRIAWKWFQLRYANRRSDYFTDMARSALITTDNLLRNLSDRGSDDFGLHSWLNDNRAMPMAVDKYGSLPANTNRSTSVGFDASGYRDKVNDVSVGSGSGLASLLNTAGLRALFAQEKMLRITQAAKKTYDDQVLAHFGVKVPHDVKHQITHFGHDVMKYKVAEVVSTAQTQEGVLGEQAGRLYGQSRGGSHKFTVPCHGVIMAITHVAPDYSYLVPENRINSYSHVGDFWRPEYDHLGRQPVFRREIQWNAYDTVSESQSPGIFAADVVGWQPAYSENKRRFNKVSYAFSDGTYFSYALVSSPLAHLYNQRIYEQAQPNRDWTDGSYLYRNKISPHDTDGIFGASYNGRWQEPRPLEIENAQSVSELNGLVGADNVSLYKFTYAGGDNTSAYMQELEEWLGVTGLDFTEHPEQVYATDPFILHADITCNKVSSMSKNSLPKLDM